VARRRDELVPERLFPEQLVASWFDYTVNGVIIGNIYGCWRWVSP